MDYQQGERILLLGNTNPNVLLTGSLIDPSGKAVKTLEIATDKEGVFSEEKFKIPLDGMVGTWKIKVSSGNNLDIIEFEVISAEKEGINIDVGDIIEIPGFGESIKFGITTSQKTSVSIQVFNQNYNQIGKSLSCTPTAEFKCEILWTIPNDLALGTYIVRVSDSIITEESTFEIK